MRTYEPFSWTAFEVIDYLPEDWDKQITDYVMGHRQPSPHHNPEGPTWVVPAEPLHGELPWLVEAYTGRFLKLGCVATGRQLTAATSRRSAIVPVFQHRYDNRIRQDNAGRTNGFLCVTGGQLDVRGGVIPLNRGCLVFFNAGGFPYIMRPMGSQTRIAVELNYVFQS